jgi:hypothetical protein
VDGSKQTLSKYLGDDGLKDFNKYMSRAKSGIKMSDKEGSDMGGLTKRKKPGYDLVNAADYEDEVYQKNKGVRTSRNSLDTAQTSQYFPEAYQPPESFASLGNIASRRSARGNKAPYKYQHDGVMTVDEDFAPPKPKPLRPAKHHGEYYFYS